MPRKKIIEAEKDFNTEEVWNIKRIGIALACLAVLLTIGGVFLFAALKGVTMGLRRGVLGASVNRAKSNSTNQLPKADVNKIILNAQETLSKLTSENLTSSQAAIGKLIQELQALQGSKKNAGEVFCEMVCKK